MVEYIYDVWGNHAVQVLDSACDELSQLNPFRYRGYYYDTETGLYYLKSRYYDPEICRFITIDDLSYLDSETINGLNLYAYCGNNPVMCVDPNGQFFFTLLSIICAVSICAAVSGVVGGIAEVVNGGSFWNGFVGGAITGAISAIGIAAGLATGGLLGVALAGAIGFAGGMAGNAVQQGISKGWDNIDVGELIFSGIVSGALNVVSFGITSCIAKGVGAVVGKNFFQRFVSAVMFNGYTSIIAGVVIGFPISLLGVVPSTIWSQFAKR